ncbi:MAG: HlyD family secretion protein [Myxococcota bacterium]
MRRSFAPLALREELSVTRMVPHPKDPKPLALGLLAMLVAIPLALALIPWVQTVTGSGRVIAFGPVEREQTVDSPVKGRVSRWLVSEGTAVSPGDPLVEVLDNDPELSARLQEQVNAQEAKVEALTSNYDALVGQVEALRAARAAAVGAATAKVRQTEQKLRAANQKLKATQNAYDVAELQAKRIESLRVEGLASERDLDLAKLSLRKATADLESDRAAVEEARAAVREAEGNLGTKAADIDAKIAEVVAKGEKVRSDREEAKTKLAYARIEFSRKGDRIVRAPRSGTVLRLLVLEGQDQVKEGDPLAVLVPNTERRAVELFLDGNDAAWVDPGRKVRIQFEGWPAVQFGGWPGAAMGTFGGVVSFLDATDDGQGNFRLVVEPDPEDAPWPGPMQLRQGVRAKGWVLLDTVTLGYEAWRQLNGFPPETARSKAPAPKVKPSFK